MKKEFPAQSPPDVSWFEWDTAADSQGTAWKTENRGNKTNTFIWHDNRLYMSQFNSKSAHTQKQFSEKCVNPESFLKSQNQFNIFVAT